MPTLPLDGGCHCGALRYRVTEAPRLVLNCHCSNCQKITGGAFATNAFVPESGFAFTKGEPSRVEWTSDAGNRRFGWFCQSCGSRIAHGNVGKAGMYGLRGGTFDDTRWLSPVGDIWTRSAQPWVRFVDGGLTAETQPADLAPFIAAFQARTHLPPA
jgi:hypothetical protein